MLKEFREFISRGNVIDLAVGIIIGAAFTAIVNSLVTSSAAFVNCSTPVINRITFRNGVGAAGCTQGTTIGSDITSVRSVFGNGPGAKTSGIDYDVSYGFDAFGGDITASLTATQILTFDIAGFDLNGVPIATAYDALGYSNYSRDAGVVSEWSGSQVDVTVPGEAQSGNVYVLTSAGVSNVVALQVTDPPPPVIPGFVPRKRIAVFRPGTPEWYLLPPEERSELLREHGMLGREFPEVLANTTSGFGLGDWEWILAFEAERADSLVDVIRALRKTRARLYTKVETPFVTGIRKSVAEALDDLV